MADPKPIKICLTNKGEDTETPWAIEVGPAPNAPPGSMKVKLVNVPFMHAKPTWGDTIVVSPKAGDYPTWDREGVPWKNINTRILEDGGRWAMILDYLPYPGNSDGFAQLGRACELAKIICEGAWGPRENDPGRAYLAVAKELSAEHVMGILEGASLPLQLIQIHPEPKKKTAPVIPARAQTVTGISEEAGRPPAKPAVDPGAGNASSALKKGAKAATKAAEKEAATAAKEAAKQAAAVQKAAAREAAVAAKAKAAAKAAAEKAAVEKAAAKAAQAAVKAALAKKPAAPKAKAKPAPAKKPAKKK